MKALLIELYQNRNMCNYQFKFTLQKVYNERRCCTQNESYSTVVFLLGYTGWEKGKMDAKFNLFTRGTNYPLTLFKFRHNFAPICTDCPIFHHAVNLIYVPIASSCYNSRESVITHPLPRGISTICQKIINGNGGRFRP